MWRQHKTIRTMALAPFSELLVAVAKDPAMLVYLDGARNSVREVNENFALEVTELHTLGAGFYSQSDVVEAARAATGWLFHHPFLPDVAQRAGDTPEWEPIFVPDRHVSGPKTILGVSADHDLDSFLELLIDHPATSGRVAGKLFESLVGRDPTRAELASITRDWDPTEPTLALIESIVDLPAFLDPATFDTRLKTPVERLVGLVQAYGSEIPAEASYALHAQSYLPFNPPSPAGFPSGDMLLGPHQLLHAFDFLNVIDPPGSASTDTVLVRLGLHSVSARTRAVLDRSPPTQRLALAFNSPEYALT